MLHTITKRQNGKRVYKQVSDILITKCVGENNSKIVFKDGDEWIYPWTLFVLAQVLGYCLAYANRQLNPDRLYTDSYLAALENRVEVSDLEVSLSTIAEQARHGNPMYAGWIELLEKEDLLHC